MNMKFCLPIMLVFSFSFMIYAQNTTGKTENTTQVQPIKYPPREEFNMRGLDSTVKTRIEDLAAKLKNKKIKGPDYQSNSSFFMTWYNHPYIEEATRINRKWFKQMSDVMGLLSKFKVDMDISEERNLKERYEADKLKYEKFLKDFRNLLKNPPKLSDKEMEQVRAKKNR